MYNNKIASVISTSKKNARRFVKLRVMGNDDVQEINQIAPHGIDSSPIPDARGLHVETSANRTGLFVGVVNNNQESTDGEIRLFSTDTDGQLQTYIHLHDDGTIEVGGDADNMVRYAPVGSTVQELQDDVNNLKNLISSWVPVPNDGGAALKTTLATWYATPLVEDITDARIDEIKTL